MNEQLLELIQSALEDEGIDVEVTEESEFVGDLAEIVDERA